MLYAFLQDIEGVPKIAEGINPATYALQVPASCGRRFQTCMVHVEMHLLVKHIRATTFANLQVTNRSKERDLDKDFADVYEQSDLHKCAIHPSTMSLCSALQFLRCTADVVPRTCSTCGHEYKAVRSVAALLDWYLYTHD